MILRLRRLDGVSYFRHLVTEVDIITTDDSLVVDIEGKNAILLARSVEDYRLGKGRPCASGVVEGSTTDGETVGSITDRSRIATQGGRLLVFRSVLYSQDKFSTPTNIGELLAR